MQSMRILIADDEPIIRMDLKEMLEEVGQQVVGEAANGLQALELARKYRPDLVIMDVRMPKMDGLKSAKLITGEKIAPVIMLTALGQEEVVQQACQNGVTGYLLKPVDPPSLMVSLRVAYEKYKEIHGLKLKVSQLRENLKNRKLVEQAKGLLMEQEGLTEKDALNKLQKISMSKGISVKYVAEKIISAYAVKNKIN